MVGEILRIRPESFADHTSQARMFFLSQTEPEQNHIVSALVFELSKCVVPRVRTAMLARLASVDETLAARVAAGLGVTDPIVPAPTAAPTREMEPSPALSILAKAKPTLEGRKIGCLVTDGSDGKLVAALAKAAKAAGAAGVTGSVRPRPVATRAARVSSMLAIRASTAWRTRGRRHLLSSKIRAATMWSCSGLVWLAKNSRAWL